MATAMADAMTACWQLEETPDSGAWFASRIRAALSWTARMAGRVWRRGAVIGNDPRHQRRVCAFESSDLSSRRTLASLAFELPRRGRTRRRQAGDTRLCIGYGWTDYSRQVYPARARNH